MNFVAGYRKAYPQDRVYFLDEHFKRTISKWPDVSIYSHDSASVVRKRVLDILPGYEPLSNQLYSMEGATIIMRSPSDTIIVLVERFNETDSFQRKLFSQ